MCHENKLSHQNATENQKFNLIYQFSFIVSLFAGIAFANVIVSICVFIVCISLSLGPNAHS